MPSSSSSRAGQGTKDLFTARSAKVPEHYLIAHSDGGARGNPGPAAYGVVIKDQSGRKIAALSEYLGHQTNNVAEYRESSFMLVFILGPYYEREDQREIAAAIYEEAIKFTPDASSRRELDEKIKTLRTR